MGIFNSYTEQQNLIAGPSGLACYQELRVTLSDSDIVYLLFAMYAIIIAPN